jgi:hypothetical protein
MTLERNRHKSGDSNPRRNEYQIGWFSHLQPLDESAFNETFVNTRFEPAISVNETSRVSRSLIGHNASGILPKVFDGEVA